LRDLVVVLAHGVERLVEGVEIVGAERCVVGAGSGCSGVDGRHGVTAAALYDAAGLWETRHFNTAAFAVSGALQRL
jgi:hypothetical protein